MSSFQKLNKNVAKMRKIKFIEGKGTPLHLGRVHGGDLQSVFVEEQHGSPDGPVVHHPLEEEGVELGDDLGDEEALVAVGPQQDLHVGDKVPLVQHLQGVHREEGGAGVLTIHHRL